MLRHKRIFILVFLSIFLLISCSSPAPQTIEVTRVVPQTVISTQLVEVIITATPIPITSTPIPTQIPSATFTFAPTNTEAPTMTPTATTPPEILTQTAQASLDALLKMDKGPGVYLVNADIAPGIWRSTPGSDDCYWKRSDRTGEIIDNYYSFSGGTIYIDPTDFSVELSTECGIWTYLSAP
jgi:hypothetical protein